jgi:ubiquinone/menaquinone biosynthesis C-methylase UbiE
MAQSISIKKLGYQAKGLQLNESNSILFEVPSLDSFKESDDSPSAAPCYRLVLLLGLHARAMLSNTDISSILDLKGIHNIDDVLIWAAGQYELDHVRVLKEQGIDVLHCAVPSAQFMRERALARFQPVPGRQLSECLMLNHLAANLMVRLKKYFHRVLSDIAAASYDRKYASDKPATSEFMKFEDVLLRRLLVEIRKGDLLQLAVDVGCGTGRHSTTLARECAEVVALDFSKNMIAVAKKEKRKSNDTKIRYLVSDFEYESLPNEGDIIGKCDLVVASFGMGSFVEDTPKMLRRFHSWLKPGGHLFICFYNKDSLLQRLKLPWREHGLATTMNAQTRSLNVELAPGVVFTIFCKPFDPGTARQIGKVFKVLDVVSFPATLSIFPPRVLQGGALDLLRSIDAALNEYKLNGQRQFLLGHYVVVTAQRPGTNEDDAYHRLLRALEPVPNEDYELIEHEPVFSVDDVLTYFPSVAREAMVKRIVLRVKALGESKYSYAVVCCPAHKSVDVRQVALTLGVGRDRVELANEEDIIGLGLKLGAVGPLAFMPGSVEEWLVHRDVEVSDEEWLYMGSGDNQTTLKIKKSAFFLFGPRFRSYSSEA